MASAVLEGVGADEHIHSARHRGQQIARPAGQAFIQQSSNQYGQNVGNKDFAIPNQDMLEDVLYDAGVCTLTGALQGGRHQSGRPGDSKCKSVGTATLRCPSRPITPCSEAKVTTSSCTPVPQGGPIPGSDQESSIYAGLERSGPNNDPQLIELQPTPKSWDRPDAGKMLVKARESVL